MTSLCTTICYMHYSQLLRAKVVTQLRMCHDLLIIGQDLRQPFPASTQDHVFPACVCFTQTTVIISFNWLCSLISYYFFPFFNFFVFHVMTVLQIAFPFKTAESCLTPVFFLHVSEVSIPIIQTGDNLDQLKSDVGMGIVAIQTCWKLMSSSFQC